MYKNNKQSGFAHLLLVVIIVAILVLVGLVGSRVINKSKAYSGGMYNYANCTLNFKFYIYGYRTAEVDQYSRGAAVTKTVVELKNFPDAKKIYTTYSFVYKYTLPSSRYDVTRTATVSAYCPHTSPQWRTYVRNAVQPGY